MCKFIEQIAERLPSGSLKLCKPVERFERPIVALIQDDPGARDPISLLSMDEVAQYVEWLPIALIACGGVILRETFEKRP